MPREVRRQIFCFLHYQGVYSQNQIIPSQMLPQISGIPENNFRSPWAKRDLRNARDFRKFSRCSQRKFVWLFIFKYVHIFFGLAAPLLFREFFSFHLRPLIRCRTGAIATPPLNTPLNYAMINYGAKNVFLLQQCACCYIRFNIFIFCSAFRAKWILSLFLFLEINWLIDCLLLLGNYD